MGPEPKSKVHGLHFPYCETAFSVLQLAISRQSQFFWKIPFNSHSMPTQFPLNSHSMPTQCPLNVHSIPHSKSHSGAPLRSPLGNPTRGPTRELHSGARSPLGNPSREAPGEPFGSPLGNPTREPHSGTHWGSHRTPVLSSCPAPCRTRVAAIALRLQSWSYLLGLGFAPRCAI